MVDRAKDETAAKKTSKSPIKYKCSINASKIVYKHTASKVK
jgi:hypothetical protein